MSADPTRFGLIGCGNIGPSLAAGAADADGAELVACCDLIEENASGLAEEFDLPAWYTDHEEMLDEEGLDAAIIGTPSGTHSALTIDCAEAGVHVLCQKPLDVKVDRLDAMIEACDDAGVKLGGLFGSRFDPGPHRTKQVLEDGELGDIAMVNATMPVWRSQDYYDSGDWRGTYEMDGGCLFNQGVHMVDRLGWFMDGYERVYADLGTIAHDMEAEDVAAVTVRYGNGVRGSITATTATRNYPIYDRIEIYGDEGYLITSNSEILEFATDEKGEVDIEEEFEKGGFAIQIQDMAAAIREDRDPVITGREARHAPDAILAMYHSDEHDEPIGVEEFLESARS